MIKKMMLFAMAIGALLAVPAMASANGAIQDTANLSTAGNGTNIEVTGTVGFATAAGGFRNCVLHATLAMTGPSTGTVTNIEITKTTCEGTGALGNCNIESAVAEGTWHVDVGTHDLTLTNVYINGTNNAACGNLIEKPGLFEDIDLSFPEITLTPAAESGTSLDHMAVSGSGTAIIAGGAVESEATASGEIGAVESDLGTWQIETLEEE